MKTTRKVALLLSIVMALSLIAGCAKTAKSARLKVDGKTVKMDSIMTIDGEVHAKMTPEDALALVEDIRRKEAATA